MDFTQLIWESPKDMSMRSALLRLKPIEQGHIRAGPFESM